MSENQSEQPKRKRGQRGPGKKFQNQNPPQPQSEKSESNSDPLNDLLNVEVESHNSQPAEQEKGFGATLRRAAESSGLFDDSPTPTPSKAKKAKANQEEFNSLVIAVLTLGVSFANMRPEIKPNESELGVFSNHLTGILIRHLPIAKGLSADALDVIGIFAVISGYYARVSPELKRPQPKATPALYPEPIPAGPADPISDLSPEAGEFLRAAQSKTARD